MSDRVCLGRAGGLLAVALAAGPAAGQCDEPILALYGDDQWERFGYSVQRSVDAFGDLDGDGREDVLLGAIAADFQGSRAGGAYVFAADCACPADIDGDGDGDVNDFFAYLDLFAAGDPRADIDGDGDVDVNDFFGYLDAFAAGCA